MKTWLIKMMIGARLNFEQVRTYVLTRIHNDKQKPYAQGLYEQTNCFPLNMSLTFYERFQNLFSMKKRLVNGMTFCSQTSIGLIISYLNADVLKIHLVQSLHESSLKI